MVLVEGALCFMRWSVLFCGDFDCAALIWFVMWLVGVLVAARLLVFCLVVGGYLFGCVVLSLVTGVWVVACVVYCGFSLWVWLAWFTVGVIFVEFVLLLIMLWYMILGFCVWYLLFDLFSCVLALV